jgi:hypothetical protein
MFTSPRFLTQKLGIDAGIASFFVDRRVPDNNAYWKGRLLYIASGTGYLFIPVVYDMLLRLGADRNTLLEEAHLERMEGILDNAGKVEFEHLPLLEHVACCRDLMTPFIRNNWLWNALEQYFVVNKGAPTGVLGQSVPPLNRADTFLFSFCDLPGNKEETVPLIRYWYALIGTFLLLDDVMDWDWDMQYGEENALRYLGDGKGALLKGMSLLDDNFKVLCEINPDLGTYYEALFHRKIQSEDFQRILNSTGPK